MSASQAEGRTLTWTRITDSDEAASFLPAWFGSHMIGLRGKFGLLLTTGDVLKITSIGALHQSSGGIILLDVLLDHAGVPDGNRSGVADKALSGRTGAGRDDSDGESRACGGGGGV